MVIGADIGMEVFHIVGSAQNEAMPSCSPAAANQGSCGSPQPQLPGAPEAFPGFGRFLVRGRCDPYARRCWTRNAETPDAVRRKRLARPDPGSDARAGDRDLRPA